MKKPGHSRRFFERERQRQLERVAPSFSQSSDLADRIEMDLANMRAASALIDSAVNVGTIGHIDHRVPVVAVTERGEAIAGLLAGRNVSVVIIDDKEIDIGESK